MPITKATQNVIAPNICTTDTAQTITGSKNFSNLSGNASSATALATGSTTARTLANRFNDVVNVKDFGAVGNGVADDTAAIQAAINANIGKAIYFPRGEYHIYNSIFVNFDQVGFFSDAIGQSKIVLMNDNPSITAAIVVQSPTIGGGLYRNTFQNIWVTRKANSNTFQTGMTIERVQDLQMSGVEISGFPVALDVRGGINCIYNNLRLSTFTNLNTDVGYGVLQIRAATSGVASEGYTHLFSNCHISGGTADHALSIRGTDYITFTNSYMAPGRLGAVLIETNSQPGIGNYQNNFDNCYFDRVNTTDYPGNRVGININNGLKYSIGTKITDSIIAGWDTAIQINKSFDTTIEVTGCRIYDNIGSAISVNGGFTNLVIVGNQFHNNTTTTSGNAVIDIQDLISTTITGNIFSFVETRPFPGTRDVIRLAGTIDSVTITGNAFNTFSSANITDLSNTATITNFVLSGNASDNPTSTIVGTLANKNNTNPFALDWYEEKTFTPVLSFGGSSTGITYSNQTGSATRIGDRVYFDLYLGLTSKGTSIGEVQISTLPFNRNISYPTTFSVLCTNLILSVGDSNIDSGPIGSNAIGINKNSSGTIINLTNADFQNNTLVIISGTYKVE